MSDQVVITPAPPSRFAGVLYHARHSTNLLQLFLKHYAIVVIVYAATNLVYYYFNTPFQYALSDVLSIYILYLSFLLTSFLWIVIFLLSIINKNLVYRLIPIAILQHTADTTETISIIAENFEKEVNYTEKEAIISNKMRAIYTIEERISSLRLRTGLMLYVVGALLIGASFIIVFAGSLTNLDASAVSNVDKVTNDIAATQKRLARLSQVEELKKASSNDQNAAKKLASLTDSDSTLPMSDSGISAAIAIEQDHLKQAEALLKEAWEKELGSEHGYSDTRYLIATAITRIGVVLVIIFLANILLGLYRYNTGLITFYNSRRDLLQLWDGKGLTVDKLKQMTVPDVKFGKEPKHPLEDIIRQVIAKGHPGISITTASEKKEK